MFKNPLLGRGLKMIFRLGIFLLISDTQVMQSDLQIKPHCSQSSELQWTPLSAISRVKGMNPSQQTTGYFMVKQIDCYRVFILSSVKVTRIPDEQPGSRSV